MEKHDKALEPYKIEKVEIALKWHGKKQKLLVVQRGSKSDISLNEKDTEYKKQNENLIFICNLGSGKIYYKISNDEFWSMAKKSNSNEVIWTKLEDHDFTTILAIGVLHEHNFDSTQIGLRQYLRKDIKKKIRVFNDRFHKKKRRK